MTTEPDLPPDPRFPTVFYAGVVEAMGEGVIVYDADGEAVLVNPQAVRLLHLSEAQIKGEEPIDESWEALRPDGGRLAFEELPVPQALRTGEAASNVLLGIRRAGETVWLSSNAELVPGPEGRPGGAIATFRDATELIVARDIDRTSRELATHLLSAPLGDHAPVVDAHLAAVGRVTRASRVLHITVDRQLGRAVTTFHWAADGSPLARVPGGVPVDLMAGLLGRLSRRELVVVHDRDRVEVDLLRRRLADWGIASGVVAPIMVANALAGFVIVGWAERLDPDQRLLDFIMLSAELLAARFERERVHADLEQANSRLDERVRERTAQLAAAEGQTRALIDALPDMLVDLDEAGRFLQVHTPDDFGLPVDESALVGLPVDEFVGVDVRDQAEVLFERLRSRGGLEVLEYAMTIDGAQRQFECRLVAKPDGGILGVVRDVTGSAARAQLLQEQSMRLAHANEELQHALQVRDEFLANVSHELRTPLAAVLGHTEMLLGSREAPLTDGQRVALQAIEGGGTQLLGLINDLLDLAGMSTELPALDLDDVDLGELAQVATERIRNRAWQKGVALELVEGAGTRVVRADARRLRQVLDNLLDNAVKFTEPGGSVGVAVRRPDADHVALEVWDTGIGIVADDQSRVFEPFVQVEAGLARRYDGSGLGLALVERLVSLHGGRVTVESEAGRGSRFVVVLPVAGPPDRD